MKCWQWKTDGTKLYQQLPAMMRASWRECEPLREVPAIGRAQATVLSHLEGDRRGG